MDYSESYWHWPVIGLINLDRLQWGLLPLIWTTQTHYSECYCHWPDQLRRTTVSATSIGLINSDALEWVLLPLAWSTQTHYTECYCHWPDQLRRTTVSVTAIGLINSDALQPVFSPCIKHSTQTVSHIPCVVTRSFAKTNKYVLPLATQFVTSSNRQTAYLSIWLYCQTLHTSHTSSLRDPFGPHSIKTDVCIQNINCSQPVAEAAHYHTVFIPQHCNFMRVRFMYFRILIF